MRMQITDRERERERERDVPPLSLSIVLIKNFITHTASTANRWIVAFLWSHTDDAQDPLVAKIFDFVITEIFEEDEQHS